MKITSPISPTVNFINKCTSGKFIKKTLSNFLAKISHVKNSNTKINNQPYGFAKVFSNNYSTSDRHMEKTGYVSHFGKTQEPAIFIHGCESNHTEGKGIEYYKGITFDDKNIEGKEAVYKLLNVKEFVAIVKKDFNLDLHRTGNTGVAPLHLICCYSGGFSPNTIAGQLSRELERTVISYGDNSILTTFGSMTENMSKEARIYTDEDYSRGKFLRPLHQVIHFPDGKPGQIRQ